MWSVFPARPFDGSSARRFTLFLLTIMMALLTAIAGLSAPVRAQEAPAPETLAMATWNGENLEYNQIPLIKAGTGRNLPSLTGTVCQSSKNVYSSDIYTNAQAEPGKSLMIVICLDESADANDKSKPIPAQVILYRADEGTTSASKFKPSVPTAIKVAPEGTDSLGRSTENPPAGSSTCDSKDKFGIGWFVCPATKFIAFGVDHLFEVIASFLAVQPLATTQSNSLYGAWNIMRSFANILFVIAFLIIIYSQLTSAGLSNYGIKRLLPRLIIGAILVNISYWICAVLIDVSNITGYASRDLFLSIRDSLIQEGSGDWQQVTWSSLAGFILSGGAIVAGLGFLVVGVGTATVGGALLLLLSILVGVALSALVAVLMLAGRQALITVLVIISPLAFVAYLLPNTERYFEKWRQLFTTMLLLFPIFSVIFGGSQLASTVIMQNAPEGAGRINTILLGMAVKVIPLAITPLLLKFGGPLLNNIEGLTRKPRQALQTKSDEALKNRAALYKARQIGELVPDGKGGKKLKHNGPGARLARRYANKSRDRDERLKAYQSGFDASFENTESAMQIAQQNDLANTYNTIGKKKQENKLSRAKHESGSAMQRFDAQMRLADQEAGHSKTVLDNEYQRWMADDTVAPFAVQAIARDMKRLNIEEKNQEHRLRTAKSVQDEKYQGKVANDLAMQEFAGDTRVDEHGGARVKAYAHSQLAEADDKRVGNYQVSYAVENTSTHDLTLLAQGTNAGGYEASKEARIAAVKTLIDKNDTGKLIELSQTIDQTSSGEQGVYKALAGGLLKSSAKPIFMPASELGELIPEGRMLDVPENRGANLTERWVRSAVATHKYDVNGLVSTDNADINYVRQVLANRANGVRDDLDATTDALGTPVLDVMRTDIKRIFSDPREYSRVGKRADAIRELGIELGIAAADMKAPTP